MVKGNDKREGANRERQKFPSHEGTITIRVFGRDNDNILSLGIEVEKLKVTEALSYLDIAKDRILEEIKINMKVLSTHDKGGYDRTVEKLRDLDID